MTKACLIIVFNHRYDKNIPVLEKMYGRRFSHIFFLVPFYDGDRPNVIPVYESSHYFQSFFAQAFHRFYEKSFTHYIFLGDDCILNPAINEHNLATETGLTDGADFIPGIIEFHKIKDQPWWHTYKGIEFFTNRKGAEIARELPAREAAIEKFKYHGFEVKSLSRENIFGSSVAKGKKKLEYWLFSQYHFNYRWKKFKNKGRIELPYPVVGSYSDLLIITSDSIRQFCHYCGVMAAAGLFVEIAIPTALLLSSNKIKEEKDLRLKGKALWTQEEIEGIENQYNRSLSALKNGFPKDQLFYHPVKLSKWNNDL